MAEAMLVLVMMPSTCSATPTVHSGDDAKGCFEQLISSGASYLVGVAVRTRGAMSVTTWPLRRMSAMETVPA